MDRDQSIGTIEGLLYVGVRHKSPPIVSQAVFRTWYDEVHIPDLCNAQDGITIALRYKHTSPKADVERGEANAEISYPYLTVYKLHDIHWLKGEGFLSVMHDSNLLPAEVGHNAFRCFDVQLRTYELVARSSMRPGTDRPKYVVTVGIPSADPARFGEMDKVWGATPGCRGSLLYAIVYGFLVHEQKMVENTGLVIVWYDEMPKTERSRPDDPLRWQEGSGILIHCT